ncbi:MULTISPECIES: TonB-dependent receptor [unclassified Sphingomonas]|uniref:TonB-dependent receptor n=1 Tax=unclassified Sphingomonas TaxID=196159 RepID=UPI000A85672F|nr:MULTISPECIES: TonB-dependent receptor [unclassified Sphingomonas]
MTIKGKTRVVGASVIVLALTGTAHAQQATAPQAAEAVSGIQDIVVTAQKRSESLQKTPAAVTAFTGDALVQTGTTDLRAVQNIVPGARFQQEGATTQVILRGVGSNLDFGNVEPTVAFNVNGIYTPREGTSQPFFDLERIEVLPGPQGTLYGRNALGGTVNVSFKRPTRELESSGVLEAGNYSLKHVTLVQNLPLGESFAVRAAADYTDRDGYMETGAYSKKDFAGRLSMLYDPNEDFSLYLWGTYVNRDGSPSNLVNKGFDPATGQFSENAFLRDNPWDELRVGAFADPALLPFGQPIKEKQKYHLWTFGGELNLKLNDSVSLTYVPGYFRLDSNSRYWLGVIPDYKEDDYRLVTQELRLSGSSDRLNWLVGLYAYTQKTHGYSYVGQPTGPFGFIASGVLHHRVKGIALFGQATYELTDAWRLTVGGRGSLDKRKATGISTDVGNLPYSFNKSFNRIDYKLGTEYDLTSTVMAYLTYQTAYQPGTFNEVPSTPTASNLINSPKLSSITGGMKTRFLDNRLQFNVEGFYYSYRDLLLQAYDASKPYNPIFNAKAETYGAQLDSVFQPTPDDRFSASVGYLHARTKKYTVPGLEAFENLSLPYAATWTINLAYHHDFHLANGYIRPTVDARYESSYYADFVHTPGTRQKPVWRENAAITYFADSNRWSAGLWIKNISNKAVIAATAAAGIPGPATAYLEEPRTYGARVSFNF